MVNMAWYDTAQISKIKKTKEESEWFTAIALSATQLERHGYLEIKEYLESLNVKSDLIDKILEKTPLCKIAECLQIIGKIDGNEFDIIKSINKERNKFVHRKGKEEFERGAEAQKKYAPLIDEAIRILEEKLNVRRLYISRT